MAFGTSRSRRRRSDRGAIRTPFERRLWGGVPWAADGGLARAALGFELLENRALLSATTVDEVPLYQLPQYHLFNYGGYLTGPANDAPVEIAENFLKSNAASLGILPADVDHYLVTTNYVTQSTSATTLTFQQSVHGIGVANANFNITVSADGRVLDVGGGFVRDLAHKGAVAPQPSITTLQLVGAAGNALGVSVTDSPTILANGAYGPSRFLAPALSLSDITSDLRYVATEGGNLSLTWLVTVQARDGHPYRIDVDATSGALVALDDIGFYASYEVFGIPLRNPNDGQRTIETDPDIITPTPTTVPSPFGWHDTNGVAGPEFTITSGNNVNAYADRNGDDTPDANSQPDGGAGLDFTGALVPLNLSGAPSTYTAAAVVNLFYWINILHDVHYLYGFDEAARNFQVNNYGRGGLGNDAVNAQAQWGADAGQFNNAFYSPAPDGTAPMISMMEFTITSPNRDTDFDQEVVIHELGHGVSDRITGNSFGLNALQSGGLGEGWSDFWALMLTQKSASETTDGRGVGTYLLGEPLTGLGIREFRYDFDITNQSLETFLNYGIGPGQSVEVHDSGTRWAAALWDINHLLIDKYGFEPNVYNSASDAGNIKALHLVMNGLKIQPLNPSFIAARDAILMADQLLYGGANQFEIWSAFARRGLGSGASTSSSDSPFLLTSFDLPAGLVPLIALGPDIAQLEAQSGTTDFVFTVTASGAFNLGDVTVDFTTVDGTAIAGTDYVARSGTLTFTEGGPAAQTITIQVMADVEVESNETFLIRLSNVLNGELGRSQATATILNDDVDITINDATVVEGDSGTTTAVLTISIVGSLNQPIPVNFATFDGSAQGGTDYQPQNGSILFSPGTSAANLSVQVVGDTFNEGTENFFVVLSTPSNVRIARGSGVVTILDNDPLPGLFVNDVNVTTTDEGLRAAVFSVALDTPSGRDVTVRFATVDDTALSGASFVAQAGELHFAPGVRTMQVTVPIMGSAVYAPNQRFFLDLSEATSAILSDPRGIGTVIFADPPPTEYFIDDGDTGFVATGGWTTVTNLLAYQLDYRYQSGGNGGSTATWTFGPTPSGSYEIFTRWSHFSNRATDAPYTILDNNSALATVTVNQQAPPSDDTSNGITWHSLGTFQFNTGTIRVRLSNDANGFVVADAIRIVPNGIPPQAPEMDVAGFEHSIGHGDTSPAVDDATDFGTVGTLTNSVTHAFRITNNGNAPLNLGASAVQISGAAAGDFTVLSQPDPAIAPGWFTTFQILFHPTVQGLREAVVTIASDDANESPYTFAIHGTGGTPGSPQATLDNSNAAFTGSGDWQAGANALAFLGGVQANAAGQGTDRATWSFTGLAPGVYDVYATWIPFSNSATNAPFAVSNGNGSSYTTLVNQREAPGAGVGHMIGTLNAVRGLVTVSLSDDANGYVIADSVTIARHGASLLPPAEAFAHNDPLPMDVNGDDRVSPVDALIVINALLSTNASSGGAAALSASPAAAWGATAGTAQYFVDVNGDLRASPLDALLVINHLIAPAAPAPLAAPMAAAESNDTSALAAVAVDRAIGEVADPPEMNAPADSVTTLAATPSPSTAETSANAAEATDIAVQECFSAEDLGDDESELDDLLLALSG